MDKVCPKTNIIKKEEPWEDHKLQEQIKELCKLQKKIKDAEKKLKNSYYQELANVSRTRPGTDWLKTKGLKYNDSSDLTKAIILLLTLIWTFIQVPISWLHSSINCIYKKGQMSVAANYRGLWIGANMTQILAKIIMIQIAYISETQYGFCQNRSTSVGN